MIAKYPKFSKLSIEIKAVITKYSKNFEPYSDFNFTSLLAWDTDGKTEVSDLNGNLIIKLPDYTTGKTIYSILGNNNVSQSIDTLLEKTAEINLVPEVVIEQITDAKKLRVRQDRDNFDYIYSVGRLARMSGKDYKKKRNKANTFFKAHSDIELVVKNHKKLTPESVKQIIELDKSWSKQTNQPAKDAKFERQAIKNILDNFSKLNCFITTIHLNDSLQAFSINEIIDQKYAICHFEKALKIHHQHIYAFLVREVAKVIHAYGCQFVNWEQDLGIAGIRKSKMSYNPTKMLKKYTVSKKV
ncbi:MAG: phosphatidylglycerol lysyltransferase domain-containing protein [bacterium]